MTSCCRCKQLYDDDGRQGFEFHATVNFLDGNDRNGWHPMYGTCPLCFFCEIGGEGEPFVPIPNAIFGINCHSEYPNA